jgi:hypothetical protein
MNSLTSARAPDALVEAWQAPADFDKGRDHLCAIVESRMSHYLINAEGVAADSISMECNGSTTTIDILHSRTAKPHIDRHSPEWSALWILRASGHVMGTADHRPSNPPIARRRPLKSPQLTYVSLTVGEVVLFNLHRTHWMDRAADRSLLVAASFDFTSRPSRSVVEERIRTVIAGGAGRHA